MFDSLEIFVGSIFVNAAATSLLLRIIPDIFTSSIIKQLDLRNQVRIEKIKSELSHQNNKDIELLKSEFIREQAAIKSAIDFVSTNNKELRIKSIDACEQLWTSYLLIKDTFHAALHAEQILTPDELQNLFENQDNSSLFSMLEPYRNKIIMNNAISNKTLDSAAIHSLVCGRRVWTSFFVLRAFVMRLGYIYCISLEKRHYVDWRKDKPFIELIATVIDKPTIDQACSARIGGAQVILSALEKKYYDEAYNVMSGKTQLNEDAPDVSMAIAQLRTKAPE